jgi:hypothetical protein
MDSDASGGASNGAGQHAGSADASDAEAATGHNHGGVAPEDGGAEDAKVASDDSGTPHTCNNVANGSDAVSCTSSCDSSRDCPSGSVCDTDTGSCRAFDPGGPLETADLTVSDVQALSFKPGSILVDVDHGAIHGASGSLRRPNVDPTAREVISGIAYEQRNGHAIFTFGKVVIPEGAVLDLIGTLPVVLASTDSMSINGVVDARPMDAAGNLCPDLSAGPGGYVGGKGANACACPTQANVGEPGLGDGGGKPGMASGVVSGGGGGGHAAVGGMGGNDGAGGAKYDGPPAIGLVGGSGGAGGGAWSDLGPSPNGGGGGGAIQLVARTSLSIGNGTAAGGLNAGGCGVATHQTAAKDMGAELEAEAGAPSGLKRPPCNWAAKPC